MSIVDLTVSVIYEIFLFQSVSLAYRFIKISRRVLSSSNGYFFTYGDIPLCNHLKKINEILTPQFNMKRDKKMIDFERTWNLPVRSLIPHFRFL